MKQSNKGAVGNSRWPSSFVCVLFFIKSFAPVTVAFRRLCLSLGVGQKNMGLDSVELILAWEESFGIPISDAEAETMFTTRQVAERIFEKVRSTGPEDSGCLSMRAFLRLRMAFQAEGVTRGDIRPDAKVTSLLPNRQRRDVLSTVCERAGFRPLKRLPFGLQFTFGRVRDIVLDTVIGQHDALRREGHGWSLLQVREVVRAVMYAQLALRRFSDDAQFIKDLKIDG